MGNELPSPARVVRFYLLSSLPDAHPVVVKREYHDIDVAHDI
jgi:hypothetical protein